jgi:flagellar protein FliS
MSNLAGRVVSSYLQTEVQSRTPLELVVMLYDGAIRFANAAKAAIARNDIAARREALSRTLAIVSELQSTLDMDKGGAIAESLDRLYRYISGRLMDAAFKRDTRAVEETIALLTTLRDAWSTVAKQEPASPEQVAR